MLNVCVKMKEPQIFEFSPLFKLSLRQSILISGHSRPFLPPGDDESIPQGGVHGKDRTTVRLRHHSHQEVLPPYVHVSVNSTSERQVVLEETNTDLLQIYVSDVFKKFQRPQFVSYSTKRDRQHGLHTAVLHRADHSFLVDERTSDQSPELDVFDSHRHKLGVRVWSELHHKDPLSVASFTGHLGAWQRGHRGSQ